MIITTSEEGINNNDEEQEQNLKRRDWLDLTLGFASFSESSSSSSFSSSSSSFPSQLGLNLNTGLQNMRDLRDEKTMANGHCHLPMSIFSSSSSPSSSSLQNFHLASNPSLLPNLASTNLSAHHVYCQRSKGAVFNQQRPNCSLWFRLRSVISRDGELLPQVPKAYIRLKDENVTVYMVQTYLVRKLGLSSESEVEIYCMGQRLLHFQPIKYARDVIWKPKFLELLNSNQHLPAAATTLQYIVCLDYTRPL